MVGANQPHRVADFSHSLERISVGYCRITWGPLRNQVWPGCCVSRPSDQLAES